MCASLALFLKQLAVNKPLMEICESHSPSHPFSTYHVLLLPDTGAGPGPSAPGRQPLRDLSKPAECLPVLAQAWVQVRGWIQ